MNEKTNGYNLEQSYPEQNIEQFKDKCIKVLSLTRFYWRF